MTNPAIVAPFTTTTNGAVPAPGSVQGDFLRDDGTWQPGTPGPAGPAGPAGAAGATGPIGPAGPVPEAPLDGQTYVRKNAAWVVLSGSGTVPMTDVLSVKDFGAKGAGNVNDDDSPAFQACFNAAFGSAVPKPVYIPNGLYYLRIALVLTNVRGGHIFGESQGGTVLHSLSGATLLVTNGFSKCQVHDITFESVGPNSIGFDLYWDGAQLSGCADNLFYSCSFSGDIGFRIGNGGRGGANNQFIECGFGGNTAAMLVCGAEALNNSISGAASGGTTCFKVTAGQISEVSCHAFAAGTTVAFDIQTTWPISITGCRSEQAPNENWFKGTGLSASNRGRCYMSSSFLTQQASTAQFLNLTNYDLVADCSGGGGQIIGDANSNLWLRAGGGGGMAGFLGTIRQQI